MRGAKRGKEITDELEQMRSKKPKVPQADKKVVHYGHGTISCLSRVNKWLIQMKAPYKVETTRQWGPKGSKAQKFNDALKVIEDKMAEAAAAAGA